MTKKFFSWSSRTKIYSKCVTATLNSLPTLQNVVRCTKVKVAAMFTRWHKQINLAYGHHHHQHQVSISPKSGESGRCIWMTLSKLFWHSYKLMSKQNLSWKTCIYTSEKKKFSNPELIEKCWKAMRRHTDNAYKEKQVREKPAFLTRNSFKLSCVRFLGKIVVPVFSLLFSDFFYLCFLKIYALFTIKIVKKFS